MLGNKGSFYIGDMIPNNDGPEVIIQFFIMVAILAGSVLLAVGLYILVG
jgi:hypothetical protein